MTQPTSQAQLTPSQLNASESEQWKQIIRQALTDTRVAIPAFLTADMNVENQTVGVQIAIRERTRTPDGPEWTTLVPVLLVPVIIPRGGGYGITLPLKKGDEGLLIFCDCCFDFWWQNGGIQNQIGMHRHEFWDCGFLPGMYSQPHKLTDYSDDSLQIRADDGTTIIDVSSSDGVTITASDVTVNATDETLITSPKVEVDASTSTLVVSPQVTVTASTAFDVTSPTINLGDGGTTLPLVNGSFFDWFVTTYMPSVQYVSTAPTPPTGVKTTIVKGQ